MEKPVIHIIGGGLAGSEAAWQIAKRSIQVVLHEMRPVRDTEVHKTHQLAELVCSNSFRSDDRTASAIGLLHEEMREGNSLILSAADAHKVPAGGALAVDRLNFSKEVQNKLEQNSFITIRREEISRLPPKNWKSVIIASGPLTSPGLAKAIKNLTGEDTLSFFDAIAPIVYKDSINMKKAWFQSRYDKGNGDDYINCPLSQSQYNALVNELLLGDKTKFKEWEENTPYFEGCLPIEVMASRGINTLAFGPMKPVGLTNKHEPERKPFAVLQLRQDNALGTLFNMVGFQTKLKHSEQVRIFQTIPGLELAKFARLGGIHRNIFINSPGILDSQLRLKTEPRLRFAGQITGCEGYVESAAIGYLAGRFAAGEAMGFILQPPPLTTAMGALLNHITSGGNKRTFQPMNINFGLFPPLDKKIKKKYSKSAYTRRALYDFMSWLKD